MNKKVLFSILTVSFFFLLVVVSCCIVIFGFSRSSPSNPNKYYHQVTEYNYRTNSTDYIFANLHRKLAEDEFISYSNNQGSLFVISNFVNEKFKCYGTCYCEDDDFRRSAIIQSTVFFVVSAISLTMAISVSKKLFHNSCIEKYPSCSKVHSDTDTCIFYDGKKESREIEPLTEYSSDYKPPKPKKILCSGNCLKVEKKVFLRYLRLSKSIFNNEAVLDALERFDCEFHTISEYAEGERDFAVYKLNPYCQSIAVPFGDGEINNPDTTCYPCTGIPIGLKRNTEPITTFDNVNCIFE